MNGQIRILEVFLSGRQEVANLIDIDKEDASIKAFFFLSYPQAGRLSPQQTFKEMNTCNTILLF